ncbi:flagellar biosynthetic protein FliO [Clostridium sp. ZS2-4]|uniref:flagellar biosynthetic protein FliO n=1 Tax=Clostridium sp. ZS2-4 TaxID=2987703 RepID=UPI00227B58A6|nr:flagellar biosynthetic protein FliO [Clostridium sp. ZS2-4]MCY6354013.1 flagellar biosynthetic protein FliO [Clostridium sp. ZS2-4]
MEARETLDMLIKIVLFLPFIIFLIYFFGKYGGAKLQSIQNGRYMKILDRMPLSRENSLLITKIGEKGYVISSTQNRVEILKELDEDELRKFEESKNNYEYESVKNIVTKLKIKREDK